jgi:hypothetical protein
MGNGRRRSDCRNCRNGTARYAYVRDRAYRLAYRKRWYLEHREEHIARQRREAARKPPLSRSLSPAANSTR